MAQNPLQEPQSFCEQAPKLSIVESVLRSPVCLHIIRKISLSNPCVLMLKLFSIVRQMPLVFCFGFAHAHCTRNLIVTFKADYLLLRIQSHFWGDCGKTS